ncbi:hypothetical protein BDB00DRAFT_925437 [Zychaea mexicana]|uniref:uncharacterized protein n=1 Tax=Zychaea mexicana TaxID=64656 RepID=UPI0022FE15C6|nr:uncharacterized protein BDB00DRAFT_925437 [Zychaea mexicana]KAI9498208.1 hypothetical protein BDB00DRAFT_925437 [Zychaea mexicana]
MGVYEQTSRDEFDYDEDLDEDEYEVEKILKHRSVLHGRKRLTEYYIKWKGFDDNWNTWEPDYKVDADELVNEYWLSKPKKRRLAKPPSNTEKLPRSITSDPLVSALEQNSEPPSRVHIQLSSPVPAPALTLASASTPPQHSSTTNGLSTYNSFVHTGFNEGMQDTARDDSVSFTSDVEDEESLALSTSEQQPPSNSSASTATTTASVPTPSSTMWSGDSGVDEIIFDLDFRIELSWDWKTSVRCIEAVTQEGPVLYGVVRW